ncbi:polysaccharide biosynthesis/export family protein [Salipiger bermudensis]|uniref:polysaccharide biosynthesis/export family protein n=1 Tax=Salipiger bermudensis TaxID=344736 RepID=UPI0021BDBBE7|nr:polysaccharide biosynthesis/export family protein [Salipiger bermudensis]
MPRPHFFVAALVLLLAAACSQLPRGAAVQAEIVSEYNVENPSFQAIRVTRANMPMIATWPRTGWENEYPWPGTSHGANSSVIQTGDKLDIVIWDSQENSLLTGAAEKSAALKGVEVGPNGAVFVPYVDEVFVRGLSPQSARARIQDKLMQIAPSAQVQLSLQQGRSNSVELVGGVANPGAFPMPSRNYKILGLIADGGGVSPTLNNPRVRLLRGGTTYETSVEDLLDNGVRNTLLMPGDTVIIEEDKKTFTAIGASGLEDLIDFPKDDLSAIESVALFGGLADARADPQGVLVLREYDVHQLRSDGSAPSMQQVIFAFDLTSADGLFAARKFRINPGDTVLATESPLSQTRTLFSLIGTAFGLTQQVAGISF